MVGVLADLVGALCDRVNLKVLGSAITPEHVTSYLFEEVFGGETLAVMKEAMKERGFVRSLPLYPGAQQMVKETATLGEVVFVTQPYAESETWAHERQEWLAEHFGRDVPVIHTGHKHLVRGDGLVEDHPGNLAQWLAHHPQGLGILVSQPWNRRYPPLVRTQVIHIKDYAKG